MARATSRTLPQDLLVDLDFQRNPPSVETCDTIHTSDADTIALAAAQELNRHNAQANQDVTPYYHHQHDFPGSSRSCDGKLLTLKPTALHEKVLFQSHTTAPSPIQEFPSEDSILSASYSDEPTAYSPSIDDTREDTSRGSLQIATSSSPAPVSRSDSLNSNSGLSTQPSSQRLQHKSSASSLRPISRTPSLRQAFGRPGSTSGSNYPSPIISAMGSVTPLPSPLLSSGSPGPWKQLRARSSSREGALPPVMQDSVLITTSGESVASAMAHQSKRKVYASLNVGHAVETSSGKVEHARNRSISEYIPDPKGIPKRQSTVSGAHGNGSGKDATGSSEPHIRREPHLSEARGLNPAAKPPTPPPSESSQSNDGSATKRPDHEYFDARDRSDGKLRRWRAIKELGQGTFSRVMLATSQITTEDDDGKGTAERGEGQVPPASSTGAQPDRKTLVAIKVCEHGPRGGASEDRIEMSLKRELEIMQSINHPSLVHLKAWNIEPTRALLVLSYCPGGDLFDVATTYRSSLTAPLLRRIFSELVGAVGYLHERRIVHRDIKLENVLVNVPPEELTNADQDWVRYPYSVITLTDLGLSRFVADDEKLETRCGSDDYAAPEVILGQPYDGRATDAWSLGVLLYALLESRLPFDPHPNASDAQRMRSRTSHRIARVEWSWIKYAGDDGDHDADAARFEREALLGAMEITEGLLKRARSRWPISKIAATEWVSGGIRVEGGLRFREEEEGEEVL